MRIELEISDEVDRILRQRYVGYATANPPSVARLVCDAVQEVIKLQRQYKESQRIAWSEMEQEIAAEQTLASIRRNRGDYDDDEQVPFGR